VRLASHSVEVANLDHSTLHTHNALLLRCAQRVCSRIHFGWRLDSFAARADHVVAEVEDVRSGKIHSITARYLLGIDGAASTVRHALGFSMIGEDGSRPRAFMGGTMLSYFIRSRDLLAASKRPPTHMTWIINPEMRGMMYSQDGRETWVVHYQVPPATDWRAVDGRAVIAAMIGADVDFEIISGGPWTGGLALIAEHYQRGVPPTCPDCRAIDNRNADDWHVGVPNVKGGTV